VILVDIGGGIGQATTEIRALAKDVKGRMILEDLLEVIQSNKEHLEGIEKVEYDFFTPRPIKGNVGGKHYDQTH
jgi:predicted TPR repeat methyltransferase